MEYLLSRYFVPPLEPGQEDYEVPPNCSYIDYGMHLVPLLYEPHQTKTDKHSNIQNYYFDELFVVEAFHMKQRHPPEHEYIILAVRLGEADDVFYVKLDTPYQFCPLIDLPIYGKSYAEQFLEPAELAQIKDPITSGFCIITSRPEIETKASMAKAEDTKASSDVSITEHIVFQNRTLSLFVAMSVSYAVAYKYPTFRAMDRQAYFYAAVLIDCFKKAALEEPTIKTLHRYPDQKAKLTQSIEDGDYFFVPIEPFRKKAFERVWTSWSYEGNPRTFIKLTEASAFRAEHRIRATESKGDAHIVHQVKHEAELAREDADRVKRYAERMIALEPKDQENNFVDRLNLYVERSEKLACAVEECVAAVWL